MHEASLVQALFDLADRAALPHPPTAVRAMTVRIGTLAGVERSQFEAAFEGFRGERGYAATTLTIVDELASWRCPSCDAAIAPDGPLRCSSCDDDARLAAGGGIFLDRLELEVRDV